MLYFDTSIVAPILLTESTSARVERWLTGLSTGGLAISQWTYLEILSAIAREVRMGRIDTDAAKAADLDFQDMLASSFDILQPATEDFETAKLYLRRYDTGLRGGDALHLAVAANRKADAIYTLDKGMLKAGRALGLPVETGIDT